ncbi:MAG: hypothetical protein IPF68_05560 [Bacteroidales bacterium]|nr:hypothetical protein [Bacteroidales bacterium]
MEKEEKQLLRNIRNATVLSGIGMGLLLGIIMGLSVSEVVKVIMGVLTAILGTFLGFDKRSFAGMDAEEYLKEKHNSLFTALRAGWFGLAVVAGILSGMWIRTNEVFTPSVKWSVQQWTDAGYDADYARKLVTYQRFAINPKTGELGPETELTKGARSSLFSSKQAQELCGSTDPDLWDNNWAFARQSLLDLEIEALVPVVNGIEINVPEDKRFAFLGHLHELICRMGKEDTHLCNLGADLSAWEKEEVTQAFAREISTLPAENQRNMLGVMAEFVCKLEKK